MSEKDKEKNVREQIDDEMVDQVTGGYSRATWKKMSTDERITAKKKSDAYRTLGEYCAMDDPNA